jgi:alkyl hydroperoxide reductase subunit AhpF
MLKVNGVLVHISLNPNADYLEGSVPLDEQRQVKLTTGWKRKSQVSSRRGISATVRRVRSVRRPGMGP